ncbi:hypothetical protein BJ138DRAFT_395889 [Hygrophoropsis aurantiaca]|uniref:Uncharacterized protein n=1 Tax=Hygrophoropsis aurantiaca TaxID=72124 RepID=A0ACB8A4K4_9AGAM|nr:hypothetical protein BJ138DRAFT_395889 [Hygrophoropsis aurantiaca]
MNVVAILPMKHEAPPPSYSSCLETSQSLANVWSYVPLATFELAILLLTTAQIFRHKRHSRMFIVVRNDIVYIMCILGISVVNTVVIKESDGYVGPTMIIQVTIHSVLASRLLFSLHQIMRQQNIMDSNIGVNRNAPNGTYCK